MPNKMAVKVKARRDMINEPVKLENGDVEIITLPRG
jgi:hypothetical protein